MSKKDTNDALGDRMKKYESVSREVLTKRVPVIIRADGKSFHSFCRRFTKPYDEVLHNALNVAMVEMCEEVSGAKYAERHSDEISLFVTDYWDTKTEPYFDYVVPKICSVVATAVSGAFCKALLRVTYAPVPGKPYLTIAEKWPRFDCRCFNIPEDDVVNYFYWRQRDAIRNSIAMTAQAHFSHKELMGKNTDQMQEMLFQQKGINWGKLPQEQKTGFCCYKNVQEKALDKGPRTGEIIKRSAWTVLPAPGNRPALAKVIEDIPTRKTEECARILT